MQVKCPRTGTDAFGQTGKVAGVVAQTAEANNSASAGLTNLGSQWDLVDDDDEKGFGLDIQIILSEFGDFGDFFENDVLSFGEVCFYLRITCYRAAFFFNLNVCYINFILMYASCFREF